MQYFPVKRVLLSAVTMLAALTLAGTAEAAPITFNFFGVNSNSTLGHAHNFVSDAGGFTVRASAYSAKSPSRINYNKTKAVLYDKDKGANKAGLGVCRSVSKCKRGHEINRKPFQIVRVDLGGLENTLTDWTVSANSVESGLQTIFYLSTVNEAAPDFRTLLANLELRPDSNGPFSFNPQRYLFFTNGVGDLDSANFLLHSISAQAVGLAVSEPPNLILFGLAVLALGFVVRRRPETS